MRMNGPAMPRPLYLMAKPDAAIASRIAALPRACRRRSAGLLHMTIRHVGDAALLSGEDRARIEDGLARLCSGTDAAPFPISFERITESASTVRLRCRRTPRAGRVLDAAIRASLATAGVALPLYRFDPHITLAYRPDGRGAEAISPIHWRVEEILLIESIVGEARHVVLGRWPLVPRQGELFH